MAGAIVRPLFSREECMRKLPLLLAAAALALGAGPALAKKQLVIVVKGLDNPFFEAINQGCQKWNSENASSEYECFYTGPASTSDEAGEAQIVQDMLGKADTVAMAISPSNAKLIAQTIKTRGADHPDHDARRRPRQGRRGAAQDLSRHRQLPDGRQAHRRLHEGSASRAAARSARSRAIPAPTTSCAVPRAGAMRCRARKAWPS